MNTWEKSGLSRGNSLYNGPKAGRCLGEETAVVGSEVRWVRVGADGGEEQCTDWVGP